MAQADAGPIRPPARHLDTTDDSQQGQPPPKVKSADEDAAQANAIELASLTQEMSARLSTALDGWRNLGGPARKARIVVLDFRTWDERWLPFGGWLGDTFSAGLSSYGKTYEVIDRARLAVSLEGKHLTAKDEFDSKHAVGIAESVGADYLVVGRYSAQEKDLSVTVNVVPLVGGRVHSLVFKKSRIRLSKDMAEHLGVPLDSIGPRWDENLPGKSGVTYPKCEYCPAPKYTDAARKMKISGSVLLYVLIGVDGVASNIEVRKSLEPSLDQQAIDTVKRWKFTPARDQNGVPVEVHVPIDVGFRISGSPR